MPTGQALFRIISALAYVAWRLDRGKWGACFSSDCKLECEGHLRDLGVAGGLVLLMGEKPPAK
jgi:hypothetical protein